MNKIRYAYDTPSTWRFLASSRAYFSPTVRLNLHIKDTDILLKIKPHTDLRCVRNWLVENETAYRLFSRWYVAKNHRPQFEYAVFSFDNINDAAMFRMTWDYDGHVFQENALAA